MMYGIPQDFLEQKTDEEHPQLYAQLQSKYQGGAREMAEQLQKLYFLQAKTNRKDTLNETTANISKVNQH